MKAKRQKTVREAVVRGHSQVVFGQSLEQYMGAAAAGFD